MTRLKHDMKQD